MSGAVVETSSTSSDDSSSDDNSAEEGRWTVDIALQSVSQSPWLKSIKEGAQSTVDALVGAKRLPVRAVIHTGSHSTDYADVVVAVDDLDAEESGQTVNAFDALIRAVLVDSATNSPPFLVVSTTGTVDTIKTHISRLHLPQSRSFDILVESESERLPIPDSPLLALYRAARPHRVPPEHRGRVLVAVDCALEAALALSAPCEWWTAVLALNEGDIGAQIAKYGRQLLVVPLSAAVRRALPSSLTDRLPSASQSGTASALHALAAHTDEEGAARLIPLLVRLGSPVNYFSPLTGFAPLHVAVRLGRCVAFTALIACGAQLSARVRFVPTAVSRVNADTALRLAVLGLDRAMVSEVVRRWDRAAAEAELWEAVRGNREAEVKLLVDGGVTVSNALLETLLRDDSVPLSMAQYLVKHARHTLEADLRAMFKS